MPITPNHATFINLDRGERIVIEKDTDYQWQPKVGKHPMTSLKLEAGGFCIYYHLEDGIWYCSEYEGDSKAVPQLKIKFEASESEATAREAAKDEWELRMGEDMDISSTASSTRPPTGAAPNFPATWGSDPYGTGHSISMPEPVGISGYGSTFPQTSAQSQGSVNFPEINANVQQQSTRQEEPSGTAFPEYFPFADVGTNKRKGQQENLTNRYDPIQQKKQPESSSRPPIFPIASASSAPLFPCHTPPSVQVPMPTPPSMPSSRESNGRTVINGGDFVHVEGHVNSTITNNAISMSGNGGNVDWSPDLHQEWNSTHNIP